MTQLSERLDRLRQLGQVSLASLVSTTSDLGQPAEHPPKCQGLGRMVWYVQ